MAIEVCATLDVSPASTAPENWLRRLVRRLTPARCSAVTGRPPVELLEEVRAVLEDARVILERGWVQGAYFAVRGRDGRPRAVGPLGLSGIGRPDMTGACLVGAVARAVRTRRPRASGLDFAPALDVLWDALQETRGASLPATVGTAAPPAVRAGRVRDLTHWNDERTRTQADVVGLVEVAISRAILTAVAEPVEAGSAAAG